MRISQRATAAVATGLMAVASLAACTSAAKPGTAAGSAGVGSITIGIANTEGQALSVPEYRYGAEAAVKYINDHGGINGHQLNVVKCIDDGSPEGSVNCANKFIDAHAVAYFAGIDVGADAALPALSGASVPYVTEFPWGAVQGSNPDSFALGAADTAFYASPLQSLKDANATTVADFYYDLPSAQQSLQFAGAVAAKLGIKIVPIKVSIASPDWTSAVATALADHVDSMWGILQEGDCTKMVKAVRGAGFTGPVAVGSCSAYLKQLGNTADNTLAVWPYWVPQLKASAPAAVQAQLATYEDAMRAAGHGDIVDGFASASFATMIELSEVMKAMPGTITGASLKTALGTAKVPGFLGPDVDCATRPFAQIEPAACNSKLLLFKVVAGDNGPARQLAQPGYLDTASLLR